MITVFVWLECCIQPRMMERCKLPRGIHATGQEAKAVVYVQTQLAKRNL